VPRQRPANRLPLHPAETQLGREIGVLVPRRIASEALGEILRLDDQPRADDGGALQHVLQLAHVSRPGVPQERAHRGLSQPFRRQPVVAADLLEERMGQLGDVLAPPAQRRHPDGDDVEPEVEILAEAAPGGQLAQIAVAGRQHAHVDPHRARAADAHELPLLQHAQELRLRAEVHLADLVEQERAAVRQLELAALALVRPGEGALLVAEQLALDERLGNRRAVERDERAGPARRVVVDRLGDELLADAALPEDEDGAASRRHLDDLPADALHPRRAADHAADEVTLRQLVLQVAGAQVVVLPAEEPPDAGLDFGRGDRLEQVIGRAPGQGGIRGLDLVRTGQHQDRGNPCPLGQPAQRLRRPLGPESAADEGEVEFLPAGLA